MEQVLIAIGSALISCISTITVTKLSSSKEKDITTLSTEAERVSVYMENMNELLDRYQVQIDDLRKEIKTLTLENKKLRTANQELIDQIAELKIKVNNFKDCSK